MTSKTTGSDLLDDYRKTLTYQVKFRAQFLEQLSRQLKQRSEDFALSSSASENTFGVDFHGLEVHFAFEFDTAVEANCSITCGENVETKNLKLIRGNENIMYQTIGGYHDFDMNNFVTNKVIPSLEKNIPNG